MLLALDVDLVLLGHAERRRYFHETDVELNRKVLAALGAGLRVLLAVGETAEERAFGVSGETVLRQLRIGLHGVAPEHLGKIQIAYEPVWSIGAGGTPASPEDVEPIAKLIRSGCARAIRGLWRRGSDSLWRQRRPKQCRDVHRASRHRRPLRRSRGVDGRRLHRHLSRRLQSSESRSREETNSRLTD